MKRFLVVFAVVAVALSVGLHRPRRGAAPAPGTVRPEPGFGRAPLHFEPTTGAPDARAQYLTHGRGYSLYLSPDELTLDLPSTRQAAPARGAGATPAPASGPAARLGVKLVGANPAATAAASERLPSYTNYLIGNDPARWRTHVPNYARVRYAGVYPGIDLVYYGTEDGQLEHDFVVAPGADPAAIELAVDAPGGVRLAANGDLAIGAPDGEVRLRRPVIYQERDGRREPVRGRFERRGERIGFAVAGYDTARPLVIDPVLVYSTYVGSAYNDASAGVAVDIDQNAYLTGYRLQSGFAVAFVQKLDYLGATVWTTYLGGALDSYGRDVAVNTSGSGIVVTGQTYADNFPVTPGAYDESLNGTADAFVTQLDYSGVASWSTFLGGSGSDSGQGIALDGWQNVVVTGYTPGASFPVVGSWASLGGGGVDAFVTKFTTAGEVTWSTLFGGQGSDWAYGVAVITSTVYVVGQTNSNDLPLTAPTFQASYGGGTSDAFVLKLDANVGSVHWSTFLGGSGGERANRVAISGVGYPIVVGETASDNFPITASGYQKTRAGGADAFVTVLDSADNLDLSTYLGGAGNDSAAGVAAYSDAIWVGGETNSSNFPVSFAYQSGPAGGIDGFVAKMLISGSLDYSTYLGGASHDYVTGLGRSPTGSSLWLTGRTGSSDFPTLRPDRGVPFGLNDVFAARLSDTYAPQCVATVPATGQVGVATTLQIVAKERRGLEVRSGADYMVATVSGANSVGGAVFTANGATYTCQYTPTKAGTDNIYLIVGGQALPGNPFQSVVSASTPDPSRSTATVPNGAAGSVTTITVQAKDSFGDLLTTGGDTVVVTITGDNPATPSVTDNGNGTYTATYTPTKAGADSVAITLVGDAISGSPYASTVVPGPSFAGKGSATVPDGTAGSLTTIQIQAQDAYGNNVTSGGDNVVVTVTGANSATPTVANNGDGTYTASYTPTVAGSDRIYVGINGAFISSAPFPSVVSPGPVAAAQSTAAVPNGIAGAATTITVQAKDGYGNNRTSGGDTVVVTVTGANSATPTVADSGDGTYSASYTPTVAGDDSVAITLGGGAISGSPYTSTVGAGVASGAHSTAQVPGGTAGQETTITVGGKDAYSNPTGNVAKVSASVSGSNTGPEQIWATGQSVVGVTPQGNGVFQITYTPITAGIDQITIAVNDAALTGSPFSSQVAPGPTHAPLSTAIVPNGATGQLTTITVQAKDAYGNLRTSGGDSLVVQITGGNTGQGELQQVAAVTVDVQDNHDGTYTATYTPLSAGTDTVAISLNGTAVSGSPFTSVVSASGASAPHSAATVPNGTAGLVTTIAIQAKDAQGNLRTSGGDSVAVQITGANAAAAAVTDNGNGTYTATYTPSKSGDDSVAITLGGTAISGSPFTSKVVPGPTSAPHSTATVPAGTAGQVTTVTIRAKDAQGNLRTSGGDSVAAQITGANTATAAVTDNGNGTYTATYTPSKSGDDSVAITLGGTGIGGSPYPSVVSPGATSAPHSSATVPNGTAGQATNITVQAKDTNGNNRTAGGETVAIQVTGANTGQGQLQAVAAVTVDVKDNNNGTYTATYTPQTAGTDMVAISLNGTAVKDSPFTSVVSVGATSAPHSTATVPNGTAGQATSLTVQAKDTNGNNRTAGGDTVVIQVTGANSAAPSVTDNGNGTYSASYTPTTAGNDSVAITLGGTGIGGSPYPSVVSPGATSAPHSSATVPNGTAGQVTTFAIQAKDTNGNNRTAGGDTVVIQVTGANSAAPSVTDNGNGTYSASYTPTKAGNDSVAITIGGTGISGSPCPSVVSPGATSAPHSSATVPNGTAGQATSLTVQAKDTNGNNRTAGGDTVVIQVTGANSAAPGVTDNGNGTYSASYTPTKAGNDSVAITIGGTGISGSPYPSVVSPGQVDAARSTFTAAAAVGPADGSSPVALTLTLWDALDNPISGVAPADITLTPDPADGTTVPPPAATNGAGQTSSSVSRTRAGSVTITAVARGVSLTQTVTVSFRPRFSVTLSAGKQFLALPFTPDQPSPEAVLGVTQAMVQRWQPDTDQYRVHRPNDADADGFFNFGPGRGLWLQPTQPLTIDVLGAATPDGPFSVPLPKGWSNAGNPFDQDFVWDPSKITVMVDGAVRGTLNDRATWDIARPYLWLFDAATQTHHVVMPPYTADVIPRLAGFWAKALSDGVTLELTRNSPTPSRHRAAPNPRNWQIRLTAGQDGGPTSAVVVGVDQALTRALAIESPPGASRGDATRIEVVCPGGRAAGELRPDAGGTANWDLVVTAAPDDGDVTLAWPSLLRDLPRGLVVELTDLSSGRTTLLNTHGSYRLRGGPGERRLRLATHRGHFERTSITNLVAVPRRGGALSLTLGLTGPAEVTMTVRGLGGQVVKVMTTTATEAGTLTIDWDGSDSHGRKAPRGTYVLEAAVQSPNGAVARAVRTVAVR